jgi:hypothetical protein
MIISIVTQDQATAAAVRHAVIDEARKAESLPQGQALCMQFDTVKEAKAASLAVKVARWRGALKVGRYQRDGSTLYVFPLGLNIAPWD